jgi:hypothetical protein
MFVFWLLFAGVFAAVPSAIAWHDGYPHTTIGRAAVIGLVVFVTARHVRGRRAVITLPVTLACGYVWWLFGHQLLLGHAGLDHLAVTGPAGYVTAYAVSGWLSSFTRTTNP